LPALKDSTEKSTAWSILASQFPIHREKIYVKNVVYKIQTFALAQFIGGSVISNFY